MVPAVPPVVAALAPHVRIAPGETTLPTSASVLIGAATVRWRGCGWTRGPVVAAPPRAGAVSSRARALARGLLRHRVGVGARCRYTGPLVRSSALTRPLDRGRRRARGVPPGQGFVLDLPARVRAGLPPGPGGVVDAPMYFTYAPGRFVAYWFLFADSGLAVDTVTGTPPGLGTLATTLPGRRVRIHEGDWEGVVVQLDAAERPIGLVLMQHGRPQAVPWDALAASGALEDGTHPVVFSALASHATYLDQGLHPFAIPLAGGTLAGTYDRTGDGGPRWDGEGLLVDARRAPWYGFGGAWGAPAPLAESTDPRLRRLRDIGPLGPGPYRPLP